MYDEERQQSGRVEGLFQLAVAHRPPTEAVPGVPVYFPLLATTTSFLATITSCFHCAQPPSSLTRPVPSSLDLAFLPFTIITAHSSGLYWPKLFPKLPTNYSLELWVRLAVTPPPQASVTHHSPRFIAAFKIRSYAREL